MADTILLTSPYKPLDQPKDLIRVLELQPGGWHEELRGQLRTVHLWHKPFYEALSYTWGVDNRKQSQDPVCGDHTSITSNLYTALRRLRLRNAVRTLWVDALCINQSDPIEKGHQVSIMGDVYRLAVKVLIWLGEYPRVRSNDARETRLPHWSRSTRLNSRGMRFAEALDDTLRLAQPKWQDRAWVVQEFVLASKALLCFGAISIHLDKQHLQYLAERLPRRMEHLLAFYYKVSDMVKLKMGIREDHIQSIHEAALYVSTASCSNPRDKVYSLLSLIDPREALLIPVKYEQSTAQVFAGATFASIITQKSFAILELINLENASIHGTPSWVVDFTSEQDPTDGQLHIHLRRGIDWTANKHNTLLHDAGLTVDGLRLQATGYSVSEIDSTIQLPTANHYQSGSTAVEFAEDLSSFLSSSYHRFHMASVQSPNDANPHAVLAAPNLLIHGPSTQILSIINTALAIWADLTSPTSNPQRSQPIPFWDLTPNQKSTREISVSGSEPSWLLSYAKFVSDGAKVFVTAEGMLGIAPLVVEKNDRVVTLVNSRLPVVLRAAEQGCWRFRGFAWVHGLVGGEFMGRVRGGRVAEETFILC